MKAWRVTLWQGQRMIRRRPIEDRHESARRNPAPPHARRPIKGSGCGCSTTAGEDFGGQGRGARAPVDTTRERPNQSSGHQGAHLASDYFHAAAMNGSAACQRPSRNSIC
jgi:hypothetical protein